MSTLPVSLTIRHIRSRDELDLFNQLPYVLNDELAEDLASGRRRPEWMWIAIDADGRLCGRLAWWASSAADERPAMLDILDLDDQRPDLDLIAIGIRLLRQATSAVIGVGRRPPDYTRAVPAGWRDDDRSRTIVERRTQVVERTGSRHFVERLRFEWQPGTPIPKPSGRIRFRPIDGTEEILSLMTRVLDGTLDAHSRDDLRRMSPREAAVRHFDDELAQYRSPRRWWRIATLLDGEPIGFVTPARNDYNPIIGYLAVVPEHRGNGYINDILAHGTRILADQAVPRIRAATDLDNVPMANAFRRAGYVDFERMLHFRWRDTPGPVPTR